jgi:hypothetical protein
MFASMFGFIIAGLVLIFIIAGIIGAALSGVGAEKEVNVKDKSISKFIIHFVSVSVSF